MPPRKKTNVSQNDTLPKTLKRLGRPPVKTGTVLKMFPRLDLLSESPINSAKKSCTTQKNTKQEKKKLEKLDLANEVAMAQLINTPIVIENVIESCAVQKQTKRKIKEEKGEPKKPVVRNLRRKKDSDEVTDVPPKVYTRKSKTVKTATKCEPQLKVTNQCTKKASLAPNSRVLRSSKESKGKQNDDVENEVSPILESIDNQVIKDENKNVLTNVQRDTENKAKNKTPSSFDNSDPHIWAKDVSSSSTITCITVGSSDVVNINGKLPVLRLKDIKHDKNNVKKNKNENSLTESETSCDGSVKFASDNGLSSPSRNSIRQSLNLSISSTNADSICDYDTKESINKIKRKQTLEQLSLVLKTFDLEFVDWVTYENEGKNPNVQKFRDQIFQYLKEENEILALFKRVKGVFLESNDSNKSSDPYNNIQSRDRFSSPSLTSDGETNLNRNIINDVNLSNSNKDIISDDDSNNFNENNFQYVSVDYNDDDDALSLFAESITGIDSSKMSCSESVSNTRLDCEEYVPQPLSLKNWRSTEFTYQPTKITPKSFDDDEINPKPTKAVCEKKNADSTSINRELVNKHIVDYQDKNVENCKNDVLTKRTKLTSEPISLDYNMPHLLTHLNFSPVAGIKSFVFKGVCFYNLISNCKKTNCLFPHRNISVTDLQNRLALLTNHVFVEEYMLIRNWPDLRRKFSMLFVKNCIERKITRVAVEMAIDSIIKANINNQEDEILKVEVIEHTLLHLNNIELKSCDDLLKYKIGNDIFLYDVFMQCLAETQNFSRFKPVFVNLTNYIISLGRSFKLDVATHILERVCILPANEQLYSALVNVVKHTSVSIFKNRMMGQFEKQLSALKKELYDQFMDYKNHTEIEQTLGVLPMDISPQSSQECEVVQTNAIVHAANENRYTSPDTTNLDGSVKGVPEPVRQEAVFEPIITRTINGYPTKMQINVQNHSRVSPSSNNVQHNLNSPMTMKAYHQRPMKQFERTFSNTQTPEYSRVFRSPAPRLQRHVAFRGSMFKFIRGRLRYSN